MSRKRIRVLYKRPVTTIFLLILILSGAAVAQTPRQNLPRHATPWKPVPARKPGAAQAQTQGQAQANQSLRISRNTWTALGPAPLQGFGETFSGRVTGIAAHPTDPNTIYVTAAGGGVWKTADGGNTWLPLTDTQPTLSMGAIAIAPSNPSVIYAGTGEANNSGDSNHGAGILVSNDGGASWMLSPGPPGTFDSLRMTTSQIAVDPVDSSVAYAAMSSFFINNAGIYKTNDGGISWSNTTMFAAFYPWSAVAIDPKNPQVLYGAIGSYFGSVANGVYKSTDAGNSWTLLSNGPTGSSAGRIALAVAPSNSQVLYVVAAAAYPQPGLYKMMRSDDGGSTFTDVTAGTPNPVGSQGWYDLTITVDPTSSSTVYLGGSAGANSIIWSNDSGAHWSDVSFGHEMPHVDHHALAVDAYGRLLDGDDGGVFLLDDRTLSFWEDLNGNLNTIQFYGLGLHPTNPNIVVGGTQDNGTVVYDGSSWVETDGGDGGFTKISQQNGNLVYHQSPVDSFGSSFFRVSNDGGNTWSTATSGLTVDQNFQNFTAPFAVDPNNGNRVLYGTNRVWETTDAGASWTPIANLGEAGFSSDVLAFVNAIGIAPSDPNTTYVLKTPFFPEVFVTNDHGATWSRHQIVPLNVNASDIQVDPLDPQTAYVAINQFSTMGNVFQTTDGGVNWKNIGGNLPNEPVWSVQIDSSTTPHTLYVGADDGVYASTDSGMTWNRFGAGLPNVQAEQLELNRNLHLLGVATHGRGIWEIQTPAAAQTTVTSVTSSTPDGTYRARAVISIQVTFSGTVYVTGEPKIALNSGGAAIYSSGSGTNVLTFIYKVRAGQNSDDLDYRSTKALRASGGTISNASGSESNLMLPTPGQPGSLGANANIVIDTRAPEIVSYSVLFGTKAFNLTQASRNHLPWQITGIQVKFSQPMTSGDARSLEGVSVKNFGGLGTDTLTWTIIPHSDGTLITSLEASGEHALRDAAGNRLNGGADVEQCINVRLGDFTDDGVVNRADIAGVRDAEHGAYTIFADINGDGVVDHRDMSIVRSLLLRWP
jgi:photosystem II stability/assembly factor-like uncharacterized protein